MKYFLLFFKLTQSLNEHLLQLNASPTVELIESSHNQIAIVGL